MDFIGRAQEQSAVASSSPPFPAPNTVNARTAFLAYALDVTCAHLFDTQLHILDSPVQAKEWNLIMLSAFANAAAGKQFAWLFVWVMKQPAWVVATVNPAAKRFVNFNARLAAEAEAVLRRAEKGEIEKVQLREGDAGEAGVKYDIFRQILGAEGLPDEDKAVQRMSQEALGILFAGGETTAKTLAAAVFFIVDDWGQVGQWLMAELRQVMPRGDERPRLVELERCEWLSAIIKEVHRVIGMVTSRTPQIADVDLRYGDWIIPAGVSCLNAIVRMTS